MVKKKILTLSQINISNSKNEIILKDLELSLFENSFHSLVGQSGSGKTIISRLILNLLPEGVLLKTGKIVFHDGFSKKISYIPQDAMNSLNPFFKIKFLLKEILKFNNIQFDLNKIHIYFQKVKLSNDISETKEILNCLPGELSGGMKQRILIVFSLLINASLIIADEPTSAIDKDLRDQFLKILKNLQNEKKISILFISHDLNLVKNFSDRISVIYRGRIIEENLSKKIFSSPKEKYTKELIKSSHFLTEKK